MERSYLTSVEMVPQGVANRPGASCVPLTTVAAEARRGARS
ncbi:MAG TPA: hypothetical protein VGE04_00160 [Chloroflexia bacterium]